jgi:hypothetical protein
MVRKGRGFGFMALTILRTNGRKTVWEATENMRMEMRKSKNQTIIRNPERAAMKARATI